MQPETPVNTNRLRHHSKPTPPEQESSKKIAMSSPGSSPVHIDHNSIHHASVPAGLSSLQYQPTTETTSETLPQPITCTLAQSDIIQIALQLKEMIHCEIDYTIKATIDQYKFEIERLNKENQSLRDDMDALEQYSRRDLIRINGIPDGGIDESSLQTNELVKELIQTIDENLTPEDIIRSHRIGKPRTREGNEDGRVSNKFQPPRQIIVKIKDHNVKKRILRCRKFLKGKTQYKYVRINEDLTKPRNAIAYKARQLSIERHLRDTWTVDGKIYVKDNQMQVHVVNTMPAFLRFVSIYCCPGSMDFLDRLDYNNKLNRREYTPPQLITYAEAQAKELAERASSNTSAENTSVKMS
ncbi:Hypothetical predicted protein [Mytilus galloprovincialis]|uniref:Uncharacterized protein n=1 Tax=Mytilus galloprovincialis TaxID=29158 RepID=A0A8B6EEK1_MYTGA|nr:Hypothetical predicted protein [Mytilus galloprovincialis]